MKNIYYLLILPSFRHHYYVVGQLIKGLEPFRNSHLFCFIFYLLYGFGKVINFLIQIFISNQ